MNTTPLSVASFAEFAKDMKPFQPASWMDTGMNQVTTLITNCSSVNCWLGRFHLEILKDGHTRKFVGFHIVCAKELSGCEVIQSTTDFLFLAWFSDMKSTTTIKQKAKLTYWYLRAWRLVRKYPVCNQVQQ